MDRVLRHGVKTGASDLHFLVGNRPSYRINGSLRPVKYETLGPADTQQICENLLGGGLDRPIEEDQEVVGGPAKPGRPKGREGKAPWWRGGSRVSDRQAGAPRRASSRSLLVVSERMGFCS